MAYFKDADEVYSYIGKVFEIGVDDPVLAPKFKATKTAIRMNFTEPKASVSVDFREGKVEFGDDTSIVPEVEMQMSADIGHRFWLGKVNVAMAMAKGQMRTKGPTTKVMKIVPITKPLFETYEKLLRDAGRNDLIQAAEG